MPIGDAVAQAFADLLGTTLAEGGFIAGAIFTGAAFVAILILAMALEGEAKVAFGGLLIGAIVSTGLGWWEPWTILIAALLMAVVVIGPLRDESG